MLNQLDPAELGLVPLPGFSQSPGWVTSRQAVAAAFASGFSQPQGRYGSRLALMARTGSRADLGGGDVVQTPVQWPNPIASGSSSPSRRNVDPQIRAESSAPIAARSVYSSQQSFDGELPSPLRSNLQPASSNLGASRGQVASGIQEPPFTDHSQQSIVYTPVWTHHLSPNSFPHASRTSLISDTQPCETPLIWPGFKPVDKGPHHFAPPMQNLNALLTTLQHDAFPQVVGQPGAFIDYIGDNDDEFRLPMVAQTADYICRKIKKSDSKKFGEDRCKVYMNANTIGRIYDFLTTGKCSPKREGEGTRVDYQERDSFKKNYACIDGRVYRIPKDIKDQIKDNETSQAALKAEELEYIVPQEHYHRLLVVLHLSTKHGGRDAMRAKLDECKLYGPGKEVFMEWVRDYCCTCFENPRKQNQYKPRAEPRARPRAKPVPRADAQETTAQRRKIRAQGTRARKVRGGAAATASRSQTMPVLPNAQETVPAPVSSYSAPASFAAHAFEEQRAPTPQMLRTRPVTPIGHPTRVEPVPPYSPLLSFPLHPGWTPQMSRTRPVTPMGHPTRAEPVHPYSPPPCFPLHPGWTPQGYEIRVPSMWAFQPMAHGGPNARTEGAFVPISPTLQPYEPPPGYAFGGYGAPNPPWSNLQPVASGAQSAVNGGGLVPNKALAFSPVYPFGRRPTTSSPAEQTVARTGSGSGSGGFGSGPSRVLSFPLLSDGVTYPANRAAYFAEAAHAHVDPALLALTSPGNHTVPYPGSQFPRNLIGAGFEQLDVSVHPASNYSPDTRSLAATQGSDDPFREIGSWTNGPEWPGDPNAGNASGDLMPPWNGERADWNKMDLV